MPLQATSGAASYDGFGGGVAAVPNYIEDVFSTYLYTGTGVARTITNGIDLSTKGGLVWTKRRSTADYHALFDTARTINYALYTNTTSAQTLESNSMTSYGTSGYSIGTGPALNSNTNTFVSWTFRKQPKFFDVVTYTGDGVDGRAISHSLGSVPGCILLKKTSAADDWYVYHRSGGNGTSNGLGVLNSTAAFDTGSNAFGGPGSVSVAPTSTTFTIRNSLNDSGATYVAYIFAHNAGGFGLTGTDNVISCGSYTGTGAVGNKITLGYEPQWLLIKRTDTANSWYLFDTMRGLSLTQSLALLPNGTNSDLDYGSSFQLNADGVTQNNANSAFNASGGTYIYIAIRRGPMKVPTSGTSVFSPIAYTGDGTTARDFTNFGMLPDFVMLKQRNGTEPNHVIDRLRGGGNYLVSSATQAESAYPVLSFDSMNGVNDLDSYFNASGATWVFEAFRRAPSFFDDVCYTGTGANATWSHNLGAVPEMMIVKKRGGVANWAVYHSALGAAGYAILNTTAASTSSSTFWQSTTPTATSFYTGTNGNVGDSGLTYVAYLFATCAGVSKVGSYTGNGSSQTINCGFTSGARFVLIKRTDSTGDWYIWDTARGIVTANDPHLSLNTTAAEVTTDDTIDTDSTGFVVNQVTATNVNVTSATYIFLAIA